MRKPTMKQQNLPVLYPMTSLLSQLNAAACQPITDPLFEAAGIEVSVLRLDLLHPVISGNKWMKLQPWIQQVRERKLKGFITKGGPWSNHLHAAAFTAFQQELTCSLVVKAPKGMMTPTLSDALAWNAEILYAPDDFDDEKKWGLKATAEQKLLIPLGGEGENAARGVTTFIRDLAMPQFHHIICPVGTGTTLEGIAFSGIASKSITGINPGIKDDYHAVIKKISPHVHEVNIVTDPALKKFGKFPGFLPSLMSEWFMKWNIPTDIVYTAKMFYTFLRMVESHHFKNGESVLLMHTGGLQGNRSLPKGTLIF
jgi:1-aminocyclopropane-1-carboxylate deaminase/D-cysteine desulfhydrase-like pyridoxal-dependent ACC family enzyme